MARPSMGNPQPMTNKVKKKKKLLCGLNVGPALGQLPLSPPCGETPQTPETCLSCFPRRGHAPR